MRLVTIGNGIAALSAVESFRKIDQESEILMITSDGYPTYYRTRLSHMLGKPDFNAEEIFVKDAGWYKDNRIDVKTHTCIARVDFEQKTLHTDAGECISYDRLLLANGAHPFVPPAKGAERKGVFTLHSMDDLKAIHTHMKDKKHAVVIGGGLLGLEAAHGLIGAGKTVTVLEFFPYLLPRQLDAELSRMVQKQLAEEGMTFVLGHSCAEILGEEAVSGIRLDDGTEIEADAVLFSTGVRPNLSLFRDTALAVNKGVLVNARMQTNLADVYAAGDIAEYNGTVFGLWTAAADHGKIAGTNLAGQEMTYTAPQMISTLILGKVKLFSAGVVAEPESVITWQNEKAFHRLFVKAGKVVGAVLTGDISLVQKAKSLVLQGKSVPDVEGDAEKFMALMQ